MSEIFVLNLVSLRLQINFYTSQFQSQDRQLLRNRPPLRTPLCPKVKTAHFLVSSIYDSRIWVYLRRSIFDSRLTVQFRNRPFSPRSRIYLISHEISIGTVKRLVRIIPSDPKSILASFKLIFYLIFVGHDFNSF